MSLSDAGLSTNVPLASLQCRTSIILIQVDTVFLNLVLGNTYPSLCLIKHPLLVGVPELSFVELIIFNRKAFATLNRIGLFFVVLFFVFFVGVCVLFCCFRKQKPCLFLLLLLNNN